MQGFWTEAGATQQPVKQAVTEAMRGGFTLHVTMVRENRGYLESRHVDVPWTNKNLTVKWEHFVSKLEPGQKETWTAVISPLSFRETGQGVRADAKKAVAEMVAALYDQSLDAYLPHNWPAGFGVFRQDFEPHEPAVREHGQVPQPDSWQLAAMTRRPCKSPTARCRRASPSTFGDTATFAAASSGGMARAMPHVQRADDRRAGAHGSRRDAPAARR